MLLLVARRRIALGFFQPGADLIVGDGLIVSATQLDVRQPELMNLLLSEHALGVEQVYELVLSLMDLPDPLGQIAQRGTEQDVAVGGRFRERQLGEAERLGEPIEASHRAGD